MTYKMYDIQNIYDKQNIRHINMYDIQNVRHTKMYDIQKYMTYMCRYISSGCVLKYDVYIATL